MKKLLTGILFCALMFGSAINSSAQPNGNGPRGPIPGWEQELSPEQMEQAKKIFNESYAAQDSTRQALAVKRAELNAILSSANPDTAKIESLSREIGELRGKMLAARAETRAKLQQQGLPADIYGPDQQSQRAWRNGPRDWHHGPKHGHRHHYNGGWGCPGMMYNMMGNW